MLRTKGPKAKKSILETLMRETQGTAAQKLALFEKLKTVGGFVHASSTKLRRAEGTLRALAAMEKK